MSKLKSAKEQSESPIQKKPLSPRGLDVGTMNLVAAFDSERGQETLRIRNTYLKLDNPGDFEIERYNHVTIDGELFILGEDAFKLANVFNKEISRCMKSGLIAAGDLDGMDVVSSMIEMLVGKGDKITKCVYSVPADPIDRDTDNKYHESFFGRILENLDWVPAPLNEGMAVILSELKDDDCTGIGISFGAGMSNVCISFEGVIVKQFSIAMGGDWIDHQSSKMTGVAVNRMTALKEKPEFSITNPESNKKETRKHMEIIGDYYRALISNVGKAVQQQFSNIEARFPDAIPIVISGGTSKANGFVEAMYEILNEYEFPFEISEIREAQDPLFSVAKGCLIYAEKVKNK